MTAGRSNIRDLIFERDSYTCVLCQAHACDAHHVRHRSRGGRTHPHNLVSLCRFHHDVVHGITRPQRKEEAAQMIVEYLHDLYAAEIERGRFEGW